MMTIDERDFHFATQRLAYDFCAPQDSKTSNEYAFYIHKANSYDDQHQLNRYLRTVSSIVELKPQKSSALRAASYLLLKRNLATHAIPILTRVRDKRPFELQVYHDLARSYAAAKNTASPLCITK